MDLVTLVFWLFALLTLGSGLGVVLFHNPVHSALSLAACLMSVAGLFFSLEAYFLAGRAAGPLCRGCGGAFCDGGHGFSTSKRACIPFRRAACCRS